MKREFKFTLDGRIATRFLNVLQRDIDFDLEQPITDTYMFEVGNEIGMDTNNPSMAHPRPFYLPPKVYTNIVNNMAKCGENW
jgi:hypothetical protein